MEPNSPVQGQEVRIENDRVITGYAETVPEIADEIVWVASFLQNDLYHRENNDPAEKVDAATHQYVRLAFGRGNLADRLSGPSSPRVRTPML